ncbi:glutathione S-transferase family protein [Mangrovicoccus sp. HB161399]|uniref:glutathione S-transferase family protein n=1 Tax=Mangrovicoccus sp. HB161399 TaxID=2720392 RepID=UPI001556D86B|nr:glutathione S-transferase family protein [Mangrovicoccus sp. HB161399]
MSFTLYNHVLDADCYKVRLMAALLGVKPDLAAVDIHPRQENLSDAFLALNPAGTLPVAVAGDLVLRDAPSILVWLALTADVTERWHPRDPGPMAGLQQWLGFSHRLAATAGAARLEAMLGWPAPEAAAAEAEDCLRQLELHLALGHLEGRDWLVGRHPTVADIACFADVALSPDAGLLHDGLPFVRGWLWRIRALPDFLPMPGIGPLHELADPATGRR